MAREKLRGKPGVDPLDGHRLLCQLKVAAALMRLCNRTEITSKDWELAGIVMAVSDRTRAQVKNKLDAERNRRNLDTAKASGARKIVETRMAARAEAEDIARVADVIVAALTKAGGRTLTGSAVRRAVGRDRDRHLVPKALEYLEIDGRIEVEQVERRARPASRSPRGANKVSGTRSPGFKGGQGERRSPLTRGRAHSRADAQPKSPGKIHFYRNPQRAVCALPRGKGEHVHPFTPKTLSA